MYRYNNLHTYVYISVDISIHAMSWVQNEFDRLIRNIIIQTLRSYNIQ